MSIPLRCAAEGCTFSEELPDGATVKGKPAVQWWREDCNYRCREHRDGSTEHDLAVQRVQRELGATIVMNGKEAHARQEAYESANSEQAAKDEIVRRAAIQEIVDLDGVLPSAASWAVEQKVVNVDGKSLIYHEPGRKIV